MLTFSTDIPGTVAIGINQMAIPRTIQTALYSPAGELVGLRIVGVANRYFVTIQCGCLARIGFFLLDILDAISLAQGGEFRPQLPLWDLNEVLIVPRADIDLLFPAEVDTDNLFELPGHGDFKIPVFHHNARHYQREVSVFFQVLRELNLLKTIQPAEPSSAG